MLLYGSKTLFILSNPERRCGMNYQRELDFLKNALCRFHLQAEILTAETLPDRPQDFGLRRSLGREGEYEELFFRTASRIGPNVIYKMTDIFRCCYIFLSLPDTPRPTFFLIGPYMTESIDPQQQLEYAERVGIAPRDLRLLKKYYENVPVIHDENILFSLLNALGEVLWGSAGAYEIMDINQELSSTFSPLPQNDPEESPAELLLAMEILEKRYAYENELLRNVAQGLSHRADRMLSGFSQLMLESRHLEPLRNIKNYSIICNTLLRKAAEQGGVHPFYLDNISSDFAHRIEALRSAEKGQELMAEMIRSYCRLVRKHSTGQYSAAVQRAIACIDADLSADLRLQTLAAIQNINASYLSALFKKETGQTVTEHIHQKRMEHAVHLLQTTRLQVQSIAQHCGISDANYFTKLFKKYAGVTPGQYRARIKETF